MKRLVLSRAFPLSFAMLLVAVQLFAAFHTCAMAGPAEMASEEMAGCAGQMDAIPQLQLCKLHCDQDSQTSQAKFPSLSSPIVSLLLLALPLLVLPNARRFLPVALGALTSGSPPLRLQYQSFRN